MSSLVDVDDADESVALSFCEAIAGVGEDDGLVFSIEIAGILDTGMDSTSENSFGSTIAGSESVFLSSGAIGI